MHSPIAGSGICTAITFRLPALVIRQETMIAFFPPESSGYGNIERRAAGYLESLAICYGVLGSYAEGGIQRESSVAWYGVESALFSGLHLHVVAH